MSKTLWMLMAVFIFIAGMVIACDGWKALDANRVGAAIVYFIVASLAAVAACISWWQARQMD